MDPLSPALTVLSAMIAPAVIISACASLIASTSNRANRVIDRLLDWSNEFVALAEESPMSDATRERSSMIFHQLDELTSRARLLQRSLAMLHMTLGLFVATSVTIGLAGLAWMLEFEWQRVALLPVGLGLFGAGCFFYGCCLLIRDMLLALRSTNAEMDFLWRQGTRYAPTEMIAQGAARRHTGSRPFGPPREETEA